MMGTHHPCLNDAVKQLKSDDKYQILGRFRGEDSWILQHLLELQWEGVASEVLGIHS